MIEKSIPTFKEKTSGHTMKTIRAMLNPTAQFYTSPYSTAQSSRAYIRKYVGKRFITHKKQIMYYVAKLAAWNQHSHMLHVFRHCFTAESSFHLLQYCFNFSPPPVISTILLQSDRSSLQSWNKNRKRSKFWFWECSAKFCLITKKIDWHVEDL